jgi:hypothetical protein
MRPTPVPWCLLFLSVVPFISVSYSLWFNSTPTLDRSWFAQLQQFPSHRPPSRYAIVTIVHDEPHFIHQLNRMLFPSWHYPSSEASNSSKTFNKVDLIVLMYPEAVHKAPKHCIIIRTSYNQSKRSYQDELIQEDSN